ncbi:MAG: oligosaccharide flippase family protein [Chromatiales bacterium]|jgi:O-antigen/teichoic acid export membrane protein
MSCFLDRLRKFRNSELLALGKSSSFLFAMRIFGAAIVYLTQVLLARWAGPHELGVYVFAFSWVIIISNLAVMGFPTVAVRVIGAGLANGEHGLARGFINRSYQLVVGYGFILAALAWLILIWWYPDMGKDKMIPLLVAFSIVPFFSLMRIQGGFAHAFSWFRTRDLTNQVLRPLMLLLAIWVVWISGNPLSAVLVITMHFIIILILDAGQSYVLFRGFKRTLNPVQPAYQTTMWIRAAIPLFFVSLFTLYYPELNMILVGSFMSESDVAIYNACFRTAFIIAFGLIAVDSVILPRISYLFEIGATQELQRLISRSTLLKVFGSIFSLCVLAVAGKQILNLFGAEFVHGYTTLLLLGLAQMIRAIGGIAAEFLAVTGHQDRCLPVFTIALIATVALNSLLVPTFGLTGAAVSVVLVITASTIWLNVLVLRYLGVAPSIFAVKLTKIEPSFEKESH